MLTPLLTERQLAIGWLGERAAEVATPRPGMRRDQILDAANELFAERGYDDVTIEDVAQTRVSRADSCTTTSADARRSS